jgi:hypothetical protein
MGTRYFFFGTLMDRDVLELVLARTVPADAFLAARLEGFRRVRIHHDSFPILVADAAAAVDGLVFDSASAEEDRRIRFFEDYDYALAPCRPLLADGSSVSAMLCGAQADVLGSDEPWELDRWAARHKRGFLELSRIYMACYGRLTPEQAEPVWVEARERLRAEGLLVADPRLAPAADD